MNKQTKFKDTEIGKIPEDWEVEALQTQADVNMGQSPKSEYYNNNGEGIRFLQGVRTFGEKYPSFDTYTVQTTKKASAGSILFSVRAPVGEVNVATEELCIGRGLSALNMNNGNNEFLYYLLKSYKQQILNFENGSVFGSINGKQIRELILPFPPGLEQKAIAKILSDLDAKIELNQQMNKNLESIAQALFKRWFIDFEPWDGEQPNDWKKYALEDVSTLSAGGDKPKINSEQPTATCTIPIYSNGIANEGLYGYTNSARIIDESVTVSARGTIGFTCLRQEPYFPIVRLISVVPDLKYLSAKYLYLWLKNSNISGTGTTQQQLTVPDFKKTEILIPNPVIMKKFTVIMDSIFSQIITKRKENITIAAVRDSLLPRLMSGRIRVGDFGEVSQ